MKKSLLALSLIFGFTQAHAAESIVIDIFIPLTICGPISKPESQLKKCER